MQRLQRSQKKGAKLPPNTKCVNRPTKWALCLGLFIYHKQGIFKLFSQFDKNKPGGTCVECESKVYLYYQKQQR